MLWFAGILLVISGLAVSLLAAKERRWRVAGWSAGVAMAGILLSAVAAHLPATPSTSDAAATNAPTDAPPDVSSDAPPVSPPSVALSALPPASAIVRLNENDAVTNDDGSSDPSHAMVFKSLALVEAFCSNNDYTFLRVPAQAKVKILQERRVSDGQSCAGQPMVEIAAADGSWTAWVDASQLATLDGKDIMDSQGVNAYYSQTAPPATATPAPEAVALRAAQAFVTTKFDWVGSVSDAKPSGFVLDVTVDGDQWATLPKQDQDLQMRQFLMRWRGAYVSASGGQDVPDGMAVHVQDLAGNSLGELF